MARSRVAALALAVAALLLSCADATALQSQVARRGPVSKPSWKELYEADEYTVGHGMSTSLGLEFAGGIVGVELGASVAFATNRDPVTKAEQPGCALTAEVAVSATAGKAKIAVGSLSVSGTIEISGTPPTDKKTSMAKANWLLEQWMQGLVAKNPMFRFYKGLKNLVWGRSAKSIMERQFEIADYARSDIVNYYETTEPESSANEKAAAKENPQLAAFEASVQTELHNGADYLHLEFLRTVNMYVIQSREAPKSEEDWTRNFVEKAWRRVYLGKQNPKSPSGAGITSSGPECTLRCKFENGQMKCDQKTNTDQHVLELYRALENARTEVSDKSKSDAHVYKTTGNLPPPTGKPSDGAFLEEEERDLNPFSKKKKGLERSESLGKLRTVASKVARESGATLGFKTANIAKAGYFLKPKKDETRLLIQGMTCRFFVRDFLNDERRVESWKTRKNRNVRDMMKRAYPALYSLNPAADEDGIPDAYITEADVSKADWEIALKKDQTLKSINPADPAYLKVYKLIKARRVLYTGETSQIDLDFGFGAFLHKALDWAILKHYVTLIKPKAQVAADRAFLKEALEESKKNPKSTTKNSEDKVVHDNVCLEDQEMEITATLALSASVGTDKGAIQAAVVGGGYYAELSRETSWQWEGKKKGNKCVIVKKGGSESAMSAAAMVGGMLSLSVLRYDDDEDNARRTLAVTLSFEDVNSALLPVGFSKLCENGFGSAMKMLLRGILFPLWFGGADDEATALDDKVSNTKSKWKTTKLADVGTKVKTFLKQLKAKLTNLGESFKGMLRGNKTEAEKVLKVIKSAATSAAGWMAAVTAGAAAAGALAESAGIPKIEVGASQAFTIEYIMHPDPSASACHDKIAFGHTGSLSAEVGGGTGVVGVTGSVELSREESVSCKPADPPAGSLALPTWCHTMRRFSKKRRIVGCSKD